MPNINTSQTVKLLTILTGGEQPYNQCASWNGEWTASSGGTGIVEVDLTNSPPPAGTPFIFSPNSCSPPGTDVGSLTGTLLPNGFTGSIEVWVDAADNTGIFAESNHISYTVGPTTALTVNAGGDITLNGPGPYQFSLTGASVSGATPPYLYSWAAAPQGAAFGSSQTVPNPTISGFTVNGTYTFTLTATDDVGLTGTDSMTVLVTNAIEPGTPPPAAALGWSKVNNGGAQSMFSIYRIRSGGSLQVLDVDIQNSQTSGTLLNNAQSIGLLTNDSIYVNLNSLNSPSQAGFTYNSNVVITRQSRQWPFGSEVLRNVSGNPSLISSLLNSSPSITVDLNLYYYTVTATANRS